MDALSVCGACGATGFLLDKISIFPFVLGGLTGVLLAASAPDVLAALMSKGPAALRRKPLNVPQKAEDVSAS
jgi:hypothetical protein